MNRMIEIDPQEIDDGPPDPSPAGGRAVRLWRAEDVEYHVRLHQQHLDRARFELLKARFHRGVARVMAKPRPFKEAA